MIDLLDDKFNNFTRSYGRGGDGSPLVSRSCQTNCAHVYASKIQEGCTISRGATHVGMRQGSWSHLGAHMVSSNVCEQLCRGSRYPPTNQSYGCAFESAKTGSAAGVAVHPTAAHRSTPIFERLFCDFETELYDEATISKQGIKAPRGRGLGLDPDPACSTSFACNA